ncbi:right-handed parallel beta-helix repeat-containing protein [Luteolibacter sp. AS25]|uniref:right-handed parallel beta-helix repeat-containing protein n=1 Tax=Luteolibacter sp. AS25 TaxID=3135776 RepID=UPI00398BA197
MKTQSLSVAVFCVMQTTILQSAQIQVSPEGEIQSLAEARDAVRGMRADGEKGDIDVVIQAGTYVLAETLVFGLEDSAPEGALTRYRAADGARPVISGGRVIDGWKRSDLADGKIWVADVPWAKGDGFFHVLFDGSEMLQRAQSETVEITNESKAGMYTGETAIRVNFGYEGDVLKEWSNLEDIELYGSPTRKWMVNFLPIESIDTVAKTGKLAIPASYRMAGPFVVENCIDHLDEAGEWVLNSQEGKLYYWPESGEPGEEITAPALNELIRVEGSNDAAAEGMGDKPVEGLVFQGLQLSHADRQKWTADDKGLQHDWNMWDKANGLIRFRGAMNCVVSDCLFTDSGSDGVRLDLFARNITVENSTFTNLGGTGVLLSGYGPGKKDVNQNNVVRNNEITEIGKLFLHSPGIFIWQSGHNSIAHNHVHDLAYTGVVVSGVRRRFFEPVFEQMGKKNPFKKWHFDKDAREHSRTIRWDEISLGDDIEDWNNYEPYMHARGNVIEYNEIHDCLKLLHDGNCIYLSGDGDDNIVRHNVTYNHPQGSMIRTDDDSHNNLVEGNLLFGTMGNQGITIKGLNKATGNVFVNCQLLTGGAGNTVDPDSELSRNVFYHTNTAFTDGFHYGMPDVKEGLDYNLYYHEGGRGEALLAAQKEASRTKLVDKHSVVADPLFEDHVHGDFSFKPGSPALELGIEPLTLEVVQKMGTLDNPFLKRFPEGVPMHFKHTDSKGKKKSELKQ